MDMHVFYKKGGVVWETTHHFLRYGGNVRTTGTERQANGYLPTHQKKSGFWQLQKGRYLLPLTKGEQINSICISGVPLCVKTEIWEM